MKLPRLEPIRHCGNATGYPTSRLEVCHALVRLLYRSVFGGFSVILLPNNMVYYFFSDNAEYTFVNSVIQLNKIGGGCS